MALGTFAAGALFHFVSLVEYSVREGHFPANNFFESASLCGFLLALVFLIVYWRYHFESLSIFLFPLVFLMTLIGSMHAPVGHWTNPGIRGAWLLLHVVLVLIGYAALCLMAAASILYLVQERNLKKKMRSPVAMRLPPLATLDELITKSMSFGFVAITLAVIAGSTWAFVESGTRWISDPRIAVSMFTWAIYLLMVFLRFSIGWRGRRAAWMALTVLGCATLTWAAHVGLRPLLLR